MNLFQLLFLFLPRFQRQSGTVCTTFKLLLIDTFQTLTFLTFQKNILCWWPNLSIISFPPLLSHRSFAVLITLSFFRFVFSHFPLLVNLFTLVINFDDHHNHHHNRQVQSRPSTQAKSIAFGNRQWQQFIPHNPSAAGHADLVKASHTRGLIPQSRKSSFFAAIAAGICLLHFSAVSAIAVVRTNPPRSQPGLCPLHQHVARLITIVCSSNNHNHNPNSNLIVITIIIASNKIHNRHLHKPFHTEL